MSVIVIQCMVFFGGYWSACDARVYSIMMKACPRVWLAELSISACCVGNVVAAISAVDCIDFRRDHLSLYLSDGGAGAGDERLVAARTMSMYGQIVFAGEHKQFYKLRGDSRSVRGKRANDGCTCCRATDAPSGRLRRNDVTQIMHQVDDPVAGASASADWPLSRP